MIQSWGGASSDTGYSWIVQAWTLSVELGFYILFPFLATCLRRLRKRALICIFLIDSVLLVTFGISVIHPGSVDSDTLKSIGITSGSNWLAYFPLPLARLPEFILGMLIQCIVRDVPRGWAQNSNAAIFCMIALAVSVLSSTTSGHVISIATILFGGLIAILYTSEANVFTAFLGSRPLRVLGSASYAFYLLQGPLHAYMLMFVVSPYGRLFALPVIILASVVAWHFVEEPCRKYIVRFRRKSDSPDMKPKWIRSGA
jgi:peptidoglycan/LPS O-acetylase OafA/YrhL